jgi:hypothetical protein
MSLSVAVDVAVGLVFTYFVFSSICSGINEGVARILNLRGIALFKTINALLGYVPLAEQFWQHDLITSLGKSRATVGSPEKDSVKQSVQATMAPQGPGASNRLITKGVSQTARKALPSYISAATAITAMRDVVKTAVAVSDFSQAHAAQAGVSQPVPGAAAPPTAGTTAPTPPNTGSQPGGPTSGTPAAPSGFASVLSSIEAKAAGDEQKIQAELEHWFNDAMDRLSGWYKRFVQVILLVLAILVTVGFNVNTIHIAQDLWSQPTQQAVASQGASQTALDKLFSQLHVNQSGQENIPTAVEQAETLPIGWGPENRPQGDGGWFLLILGWLITIGALTFGAPFWFDLLTRMNSLRPTGPPPKT